MALAMGVRSFSVCNWLFGLKQLCLMQLSTKRSQNLSFFSELKHRNVIKVMISYGLVAWLVAQLAEFAISTFGAPDWVLRTFVILLVLGFPIAIDLAWAFDM